MTNLMDTGSRGHCALRDRKEETCSLLSGFGDIQVCIECDRYNSALNEQQIKQLRAAPEAVRKLVSELISSRRSEPLPFSFGGIVSTVDRSLTHLGPVRKPATRIILNRYPREGNSVRLEISYGLMKSEKPPEPWGYSLESPRLLNTLPFGVYVAVQRLYDAGFRYIQNEHEMYGHWVKGQPLHFTRYEKLRISLLTLGISVSLTILDT